MTTLTTVKRLEKEKAQRKPVVGKDRIRTLRDQILSATPEICTERLRIYTDAYKEYEEYPVVIKRAKALEKLLSEMTIFIEDYQLIVGNQTSNLRAAPIFPEYAWDWVLQEVDEFGKRPSDRYLVGERAKEDIRQLLPYWKEKTLKERVLSVIPDEVIKATKISVIEWDGLVTAGGGHLIADFPTVLEKGFKAILNEAKENLSRLDLTEPSNINKAIFLKAVCIALGAVTKFIKRYAKLAETLAAKESDPKRRSELKEISRVCDWISENPSRDFWEAIQTVWFTQLILQIESNGHSISLGRFDQYMYPFYKKDLEEGRTTREKALELIDCFFIKIFSIVKLRSWGHTVHSIGYPVFQNIYVGGQTPKGEDATNELSYLCLDALSDIRLSEPNFYARIHENCPGDFLIKCCEIVKEGFGMPAFVNDSIIVPALLNQGIELEDALNYGGVGCTEVSVPGKCGYRINGQTKLSLLKVLELALNNGKEPETGIQLCRGNGDLSNFKSFGQVMEAWKRQLDYYTKLSITVDLTKDFAMAELAPDAFCSAMVQDCIKRGKPLDEGGAVYDIKSGVQVGPANVGDSLANIKRLVFEEKKLTGKELKEALDTDFEGARGEEVRQMLLETPKYGEDDDYVDSITKEAYDCYVKEIRKYKNAVFGKGPKGGNYSASTNVLTANIGFGKHIGATPDGRKAGEPTADGASPEHVSGRKGITAYMKSVAKMSNLWMGPGGNILNVRIARNVEGSEGIRKLANIIRGFFKLGGWHTQINMVSTQTLREAQKNPEKYRDLMVRVAAYCALFTRLHPDVQEDIIDRLENQL